MFGAFLLQNYSNLCSDVVSRSMKKKNQTRQKRKNLITHLKDARVATALLGSVNSLIFFFKGGCTQDINSVTESSAKRKSTQ